MSICTGFSYRRRRAGNSKLACEKTQMKTAMTGYNGHIMQPNWQKLNDIFICTSVWVFQAILLLFLYELQIWIFSVHSVCFNYDYVSIINLCNLFWAYLKAKICFWLWHTVLQLTAAGMPYSSSVIDQILFLHADGWRVVKWNGPIMKANIKQSRPI